MESPTMEYARSLISPVRMWINDHRLATVVIVFIIILLAMGWYNMIKSYYERHRKKKEV